MLAGSITQPPARHFFWGLKGFDHTLEAKRSVQNLNCQKGGMENPLCLSVPGSFSPSELTPTSLRMDFDAISDVKGSRRCKSESIFGGKKWRRSTLGEKTRTTLCLLSLGLDLIPKLVASCLYPNKPESVPGPVSPVQPYGRTQEHHNPTAQPR